MALSLADLQAAITELGTKVDEDVAQTAELITAVNTLIEKIKTGGDFTAEVAALAAITSKITSDNPAIKTAIDESKTV